MYRISIWPDTRSIIQIWRRGLQFWFLVLSYNLADTIPFFPPFRKISRMGRSAGGSTKSGQIYQPPIQKHRKEVGEHTRKRNKKPMDKILKSNKNVKMVRKNIEKTGNRMVWAFVVGFVALFAFFRYFSHLV